MMDGAEEKKNGVIENDREGEIDEHELGRTWPLSNSLSQLLWFITLANSDHSYQSLGSDLG